MTKGRNLGVLLGETYHKVPGIDGYIYKKFTGDTLDPYVLLDEALAAREMLDRMYVRGRLAIGTTFAALEPTSDRVTRVCAMGAVMRVRGQSLTNHRCPLIQMLDREGLHLYGRGNIANVNDDLGKRHTLTVFDSVISILRFQISIAERMAATYLPESRFKPAGLLTAAPVHTITEQIRVEREMAYA